MNGQRLILILGAILASAGCGPLSQPMVVRLPPEKQAEADSAWQNMFDPPDRLDRTLLLDVLIANQYFQIGVDRLAMTSEKDTPEGRIVMEVSYDRHEPEYDAFAVTYYGHDGRQMRREVYRREDVERRIGFLFHLKPLEETDVGHDTGSKPSAGDTDASRAPDTDDSSNRSRKARFSEIEAATRPAE